jgi:predicted lipoprotein with Yx(FWY)xxD motif
VTRGGSGTLQRGAVLRWTPVIPMVAVVLLASACSNSGTAVTAPFGNSLPLEHGPSYEVKARNVSGLGPLLVDGQGITLYVFSTDHQGSPSRCYDICAVQWPPLTLPRGVLAPIAGLGIRTPLLGTAPRTDGTTQITYNGWPLYIWPPDNSPGKATGQALTNAGGRWYVIDPTGNAVQ